ncbi:hypothetical protein GMST_34150 [Geomonas silvestris]|uniref:histidine kinase n=1 Tax=Geomonas silvestris TaxID=2740184 RepID=A0A6V8MM41_9BACT|nr:PAS domain S-box protein [Geomonas silvestris]GFO61090.1 hypothetical protein GMST_34150 [Geomonas silvestris]
MINKINHNLEKAQLTYLWIGLTVSILVAVILPGGYFAISYTHMRAELETEAEINATIITGVVNANPELWRFEQTRLHELLSRRPHFGHAETRRILDGRRRVVAESMNQLPPPVLTRSCELYEGRTPIGRVEISRSLFPALVATALVALAGLSVGALLFFLLWELAFRRVVLAERQRREFLEKVLENGPHAVLVLEPDGSIAAGNAHSSSLSGWSREELIGRPFIWFFQGRDARRVRRQLKELTGAALAVANFEAKLTTRGGSSLYVNCSITPFVAEGQVLNLLVSIEDVTSQVNAQEELRLFAEDLTQQIIERKAMEEALRQSEARFRNLLQEVASVAVRGYAADGTTQYWNRAAEELYGYPAAEALGRSIFDLVPEERIRETEAALHRIRELGEPLPTGELTLVRNDGSPVSVFSSQVSVRLPGRPLEIFFIDIDLSERRKNEEEKARLEARLRQGQKMEFIGRLAGGVAHDFNNMLTVIQGFANMALVQLEPGDPFHTNFQEIFNAARRSADLTRQLLAFARKQAIEPRILDLNTTVAGMINMLKRLIGEGIQLDWHPEAGLWPVKVDPSQVDQILANLCVNARDAMESTGTITVTTGNRSLTTDYFSGLSWCTPGDYVRLAVSDDGHGMDPALLPHIFEPFFTTKGVGKGTGLGLATVYGIVKQNNGFINVESSPNCGTTFEIFIPRYTGGLAVAGHSESASPPRCGTETILVVEDEPTILEMTRQMLVSLDYQVLPAESPRQALALARERKGEFHLLLTDVVMPEMNGKELAQQLCALSPGLRHLFMSGYATSVVEAHGVLEPGIRFLQKPFSLSELASKVREVLDAG